MSINQSFEKGGALYKIENFQKHLIWGKFPFLN